MKGGGPFVRKQQVDFLRSQGFSVTVLTTLAVFNAGDPDQGVELVPSASLKLAAILKKLKFAPDELIFWARKVAQRIALDAAPSDLIYLTSGGELSTPMVAWFLRQLGYCGKIILNLHDLPDKAVYENSTADGIGFPRYEVWEERTFSACDLIAANSQVMREMILAKYPTLKGKVDWFYFGYVSNTRAKQSLVAQRENQITIGYVGSMAQLQGPEILFQAWKGLAPDEKRKLHLLYIGDTSENPVLAKADDIEKIPYLDRANLINLMAERMDVAFVSLLNRRAFRPLMSTKFYENIGLGLPILGAFPEDCEAGRVLAEYGFGWSCTYGDIPALQKLLRELINNPERLTECRNRLKDKGSLFADAKTMMRMVDGIYRLI